MRALVLAALFVVSHAASGEWRLELVRESLTGTHCRYREYIDNIPSEEYVTRPCSGTSVPRYLGTSVTRRVNGRVVRREIIHEHPLQPFAHDYDAATGALVQRVPLFFNAQARVFDPNPVVSLNNPLLQDQNDSAFAVPESAYKLVDVDAQLKSAWVQLVDVQAPFIAPPAAVTLFNRQDDGFEDVNAFFHIDRTQRYLQSLGYRNARAIAPYPVPVDAHAASGLDNSVFVPSATMPGRGTLYFGEGGTDDAEDADLVVHEYAHAMHEWIAPGSLTGTFASEARAISEGFADYWAFSNHYAQRVASGRDPFCFADWDARCWADEPSQQCAYPPGTDCLRRLDSTRTMNEYERGETAGVEHRNSAIWSSALREIFLELGKETTDTIVLESLFGMPSQPSFAVMALRLLDADRLLYEGAHAGVICDAMRARFILIDCVANIPRGEYTLFRAAANIAIPEANPAGVTSSITITDPRRIEKLMVRVDIEHPSRGDLKIELIAPDGTVTLLQQISFDRARDVRVTYGPLSGFNGSSAAGTWQLRVTDLRLRDVGTFLSWGLNIQFEGDEPRQRPNGNSRMIAAVTHHHGANETFFTTDLRLANVQTTREHVQMYFTPSGANGDTDFAGVSISIEPGQTLAFDDVLQSVFNISGTGSLHIFGDVVAMTRTHTRAQLSGGTVGLGMAPVRDTTFLGAPPLTVAGWTDPGYRYNLGIVETTGSQGVVQIDNMLTIPIQPYSHVQIPSDPFSTVRVIEGEARIGAYLAQIDNASGDSILIPADVIPAESTLLLAPVTDTPGQNATSWQSDVWARGDAHGNAFEIDFLDARNGDLIVRPFGANDQAPRVLDSRYGRPGAFGALLARVNGQSILGSRIRGANGTAQYVPFRTRPALDDPSEQHLVFIEQSARFRTNIGIVAFEPALAEVIVFDADGDEVQRELLFTFGGIAQVPVTVNVRGARALVRFLDGSGRAYASMIDNDSTDAVFIEGQ